MNAARAQPVAAAHIHGAEILFMIRASLYVTNIG